MGRLHCIPLRNATRTHTQRRFEPQTARDRTEGQRTCPDKSLSFDAELSSLNYEPGCIKVVDTFRVAECIVAGESPFEFEEAAQECLLFPCEGFHVDPTLAPTQNRAQGDCQQFIKIVTARIGASRVRQTASTGDKWFQVILPRCDSRASGRIQRRRAGQQLCCLSRGIPSAIPLGSGQRLGQMDKTIIHCPKPQRL